MIALEFERDRVESNSGRNSDRESDRCDGIRGARDDSRSNERVKSVVL